MPAFKDGTTLLAAGNYPRMSCGPQRLMLVHILVAEAMMRRKLRKDEHVHHIDGDTTNPRWTNLLVIGEDTHNAVSNRQYWYLKQKDKREEAAFKAYFDVTGETPQQAWERQKWAS